MEERIKTLENIINIMAGDMANILLRLADLEAKAEAPNPCMIQIGSIPIGGTSYWDLILTGNNPEELQTMLLNLTAHSNVVRNTQTEG